LIKRQCKKKLKSGPIYTPESFVSVIHAAKKTGEPFRVHELCFEDFYNVKDVTNQMCVNVSVNTDKIIKVLKVEKKSPSSMFYKTSYSYEKFKEAIVI